MKNLRLIFLVSASFGCFLNLNFASANVNGQTKNSTKAAPTPKTKKSLPTANPATNNAAKQKASVDAKTAKDFDKSKSAAENKLATSAKTAALKDKTNSTAKIAAKVKNVNPKPSAAGAQPETKFAAAQIITTVTDARVRREPSANANVLKSINLGTILNVSGASGSWLKVALADEQNGWISKTITTDFSDSKQAEIYRKIVGKYFKNDAMDFRTASEISDFLKAAQTKSGDKIFPVDLSFKRLLALRQALKAIPYDKDEQNPYKNFLEANEKEIVYSDPSAQWFVRSELFWELQSKNAAPPVGEEIAWQAAQNSIPGECEGYVNCYLFMLRTTDGEYLNFYPDGKYSRRALQNITTLLEPITADLKEKTVYSAPADISDRAEFNRLLTELRAIVSKSPQVEKNRLLQQIKQIGEGYR